MGGNAADWVASKTLFIWLLLNEDKQSWYDTDVDAALSRKQYLLQCNYSFIVFCSFSWRNKRYTCGGLIAAANHLCHLSSQWKNCRQYRRIIYCWLDRWPDAHAKESGMVSFQHCQQICIIKQNRTGRVILCNMWGGETNGERDITTEFLHSVSDWLASRVFWRRHPKLKFYLIWIPWGTTFQA